MASQEVALQSSPLLLEVCSPLSRKWLVCCILFEDVNEITNAMCAFVTQTNRRVGVLSEGTEATLILKCLLSHLMLTVKNKAYLKMINRLNYEIIRIVVFLF